MTRDNRFSLRNPLDVLSGHDDALDGGVLDRVGFMAAVERSLAHREERAVVVIELGAAEVVGFPGGAVGALTAAAEARIARTIRPDDVLARLDNRTFAVMTEKDGAARVAIRLGERLREPFNVGMEQVKLVPQIGVGYGVRRSPDRRRDPHRGAELAPVLRGLPGARDLADVAGVGAAAAAQHA